MLWWTSPATLRAPQCLVPNILFFFFGCYTPPPPPRSASGQLWHILRTAVTHFLFLFRINLHLSQLSLVKKKKKHNSLTRLFQILPETSILVGREDLQEALSPDRSLDPPPPPNNLSCLYFTVPCSICWAWRVTLVNLSWGGQAQQIKCMFLEPPSDIHQHGNMF